MSTNSTTRNLFKVLDLDTATDREAIVWLLFILEEQSKTTSSLMRQNKTLMNSVKKMNGRMRDMELLLNVRTVPDPAYLKPAPILSVVRDTDGAA